VQQAVVPGADLGDVFLPEPALAFGHHGESLRQIESV
jgi:hypothetical protein